MNINKMEAGPELDALIAEKVMGLAPCTHWLEGSGSFSIIHEDECDAPVHGQCHDAQSDRWTHKYSADIKAAWEVVQKLYEKGLIVCITLDRDEQRYGPVECCIEDDKRKKRDDTTVALAHALTAPLAICRAALKVVEEDVMCWS